jgi:hypothetical protein
MIEVEERGAREADVECGLVSTTTTTKLSRRETTWSWKRYPVVLFTFASTFSFHACLHTKSTCRHCQSSAREFISPSVARSLLPSCRSFTYPKRLLVFLYDGLWGIGGELGRTQRMTIPFLFMSGESEYEGAGLFIEQKCRRTEDHELRQ